MLIHHFVYTFKILFRNRLLIFWTFAFPLVLGTFFYLAFSGIESGEQFKAVEIAVVGESDWRSVYESLSDPDDADRLFNARYLSETEARQLLDEKEIVGYVVLTEEQPRVVVGGDGVGETILTAVTDQLLQTEQIMQYAPADPGAVMALLQETPVLKDVSGARLSYTMIEFYTLIAMTCLYGGMLGMVAMGQALADGSVQGRRVAVSPLPKGRAVLGSVLAGYLTQLIGLALLFVYTVLVLRVDYGNNLPRIILLALCGCLAGLSIGIAVAALVRAGDNTKTGVVISVTMLGCFFAGMMGITMKYVIDSHLPLLNRLNPANMITDGFYALYTYDTPDRYLLNLFSLLAFSGVMLLLSAVGLRRRKA